MSSSIVETFEIYIQYMKLEKNIGELQALQERLAARKLDVKIDTSKGAAAEELQKTIDQFNAFGAQLDNLVERSATSMVAIEQKFKEADATASSLYNLKKY